MKVERRIVERWYLKNDEDKEKLLKELDLMSRHKLIDEINVGYKKTKDRKVLEERGEVTNIIYMRTEYISEEME